MSKANEIAREQLAKAVERVGSRHNKSAQTGSSGAKFVLRKIEESPWNSSGTALFAYYKGTPSKEQFAEFTDELMGDEPQQVQDAVADIAGLERWYTGIPV